VFAPAASASGANPATHLVAADLTPVAGQLLVARFTISSPGSVTLHSFSSSYDPSTLRVCLQYTGETPCATGSVPSLAYWAVTSDDLAQHRGYELHILPTVTGSPTSLLGLDAGWNGPQSITIANVNLPGGCSASSGGYQPGCGARLRLISGGGTETVSASPGTLHLKVVDKSSGAVAYDHAFTDSVSFPIGAATWTEHLYPESGAATTLGTLSITWS